MPKVPLIVLLFWLLNLLRYVAHLLWCFINLLLELRDLKHLFFTLFDLLVKSFEIPDLLIELVLTILRWGSTFFLFWLHASQRSASSSWFLYIGARIEPTNIVFFGGMTKMLFMVVVDSPEVGAKCWSLAFDPWEKSKTRQHEWNNLSLHPLINSSQGDYLKGEGSQYK